MERELEEKLEEKLNENNIDPTSIILDFKTRFDYGNFVEGRPLETEVDIILSDEARDEEKIGEINYTLIRGYNFDGTPYNMLFKADMISAELEEAITEFLDEGSIDMDLETISPNFAYIDSIHIESEYENKGLMVYCFAMLYDMLAQKTSLIALNSRFTTDTFYHKYLKELMKEFNFQKRNSRSDIYYTNTTYNPPIIRGV
jgi:hypothetical protein